MSKPKNKKGKKNFTEEVLAKPNAFGLSVNLEAQGHLLKPDAFQATDGIVDYLLEKTQERLMHSRIGLKYKPYCTLEILTTTRIALQLTTILNDTAEPTYSYQEECEEPVAAAIDPYAKNIFVQPLFVKTMNTGMLDKLPTLRRPKRKRSAISRKTSFIHSPGSDRSETSTGRYTKAVKTSNERKQFIKSAVNSLVSRSKDRTLTRDGFHKNKDLFIKEEPQPVKLPDDPDKQSQQKEREAMQEKLEHFLAFKKSSRKLAREQAKMYPSQKEKAKAQANVLSLLEQSSDDESFDMAARSSKVDFLRRIRLKNQKDKQKNQKVTFDFNGKVLKVNDPKIASNAAQIIVNPEVQVCQGKRIQKKRVSNNNDFDDKVTLMGQFGDELDRIYEETELKMELMNHSSSHEFQQQASEKQKKELSIKASKSSHEHLDIQSPIRKDSQRLDLASKTSSQPGPKERKRIDKKLTREVTELYETNINDNCDAMQENFLTGRRNSNQIANNIQETGNAHTKHEKYLFMKNPLKDIDPKAVASAVTLTQSSERQPFESSPDPSRRLSVQKYKEIKNEEVALGSGVINEIAILKSNNSQLARRNMHEMNVSTIQKETETFSQLSEGPTRFMIKDKSAAILREKDKYISPLDINPLVDFDGQSAAAASGSLRKIGRPKRSLFALTNNKISFAADTKYSFPSQIQAMNRKASLPEIQGVTPRALQLLMDQDKAEDSKMHTMKHPSVLPELKVGNAYKMQDTHNSSGFLNDSNFTPMKYNPHQSTMRDRAPILGIANFIKSSKKLNGSSIIGSTARLRDQRRSLFNTQTVIKNTEENNKNYANMSSITPARQLHKNSSSLIMSDSGPSELNHSKVITHNYMSKTTGRKLSAVLKDHLRAKKRKDSVFVAQNAVELIRNANRSPFATDRNQMSSGISQ